MNETLKCLLNLYSCQRNVIKALIVGQIRYKISFPNIWRFFSFYQNETECINDIVIKLKLLFR